MTTHPNPSTPLERAVHLGVDRVREERAKLKAEPVYIQLTPTGLFHLPAATEDKTRCGLGYDPGRVSTFRHEDMSPRQRKNICPYCMRRNPGILASERALQKRARNETEARSHA